MSFYGDDTIRDIVLAELVREVLGPREGPREIIESDPLFEYLTGVLSPNIPASQNTEERSPDSEAELVSGATGTGEDELSDDLIDLADDTILNPKGKPRSFGITFMMIGSEGNTQSINVCVTWGRYHQVHCENNSFQWLRTPYGSIISDIPINGQPISPFYLGTNGSTNSGESVLSLHIRTQRHGPNQYQVRIMCVNNITGNPFYAPDHIFQPQIRINCVNGNPVSLDSISSEDDSEYISDFMYRETPVKARGQMCSAIWRDIDPQRPGARSAPDSPPFVWADAVAFLDANDVSAFRVPDLRTEFVPVYSLEAPDYSWPESAQGSPVLDARTLSEICDAEHLREALQPLADDFRHWIDIQESNLPNGNDRRIAQIIVNRCRLSCRRIQDGIDLLTDYSPGAIPETSAEARLAFTFMCRAMDLQVRWKNLQRGSDQGLTWRPFQLAFILMSIKSIVEPDDPQRLTCDLLFVPTGAGKTEAYLGIIVFLLAFRRRCALTGIRANRTGGGVAIIMRYTLRLLTIQQFRRATSVITACEYLRVFKDDTNSPAGWRPRALPDQTPFIWGTTRFSIGLWVGGGVTPNFIYSLPGETQIPGAVNSLEQQGSTSGGEPAQILNCPCCNTILMIPGKEGGRGLPRTINPYLLWLVVSATNSDIRVIRQNLQSFTSSFAPRDYRIGSDGQQPDVLPFGNGHLVFRIPVIPVSDFTSVMADQLGREILSYFSNRRCSIRLLSARASRPGYFIKRTMGDNTGRGVTSGMVTGFEIYCPNPDCTLNQDNVKWSEGVPTGEGAIISLNDNGEQIPSPDGHLFAVVPEFIRRPDSEHISGSVPIPALTSDDQIYHHPPSFVIATVDKFARLPFEPRAAALFGNVTYYHRDFGYYREGSAPRKPFSLDNYSAHPRGPPLSRVQVTPFDPPELIVQDELHLIEGPLGSMVGIYETAIDYLSSYLHPVKYIAATATVREADTQTGALFARDFQQFPPYGLSATDRFFLRYRQGHPLDETNPGRLYVGICSPGWGSQTPIVRIWSRLLQTAKDIADGRIPTAPCDEGMLDLFWTLTGYFNAIRELAGAVALYQQDIPERLNRIAPGNQQRSIPVDRMSELSSRTESTELPIILDQLDREFSGIAADSGAYDALLTTSMFGTGVDVSRLGLMFVNGQPKTTSAYIQSTGRIGRRHGGMVITFYRSTRPRDLSHYEFFSGYHMKMDRFVEPVTVAPFSPITLCRCGGAVMTAILRNMRDNNHPWNEHKRGGDIGQIVDISADPDTGRIPDIFEFRGRRQPEARRPEDDRCRIIISSHLHDWRRRSLNIGSPVWYWEYQPQINANPSHPVVLGDRAHIEQNLPVIFEIAPQSLREIEDTVLFRTSSPRRSRRDNR